MILPFDFFDLEGLEWDLELQHFFGCLQGWVLSYHEEARSELVRGVSFVVYFSRFQVVIDLVKCYVELGLDVLLEHQ